MDSQIERMVQASRVRSLLRDLARVFGFQMRYWGMDAKGGEGSLLVRSGMSRLPRSSIRGEGSSSYRQDWLGGVVELHSFCAGFYHSSTPGVLFSRSAERIFLSVPGGPPEPLEHREKIYSAVPDRMLVGAGPLVDWALAHEHRVSELCGKRYRMRCWQRLGGRKFAPPPETTLSWLETFRGDVQTTPRLREWSRKA